MEAGGLSVGRILHPQIILSALLMLACSGATSAILSAVYDMPPTLSLDHPVVTKVDEIGKHIGIATYHGNYLVEFFPWMKYLPSTIASWKLKTEGVFVEFTGFFNGLFQEVERQMVWIVRHTSVRRTMIFL